MNKVQQLNRQTALKKLKEVEADELKIPRTEHPLIEELAYIGHFEIQRVLKLEEEENVVDAKIQESIKIKVEIQLAIRVESDRLRALSKETKDKVALFQEEQTMKKLDEYKSLQGVFCPVNPL